MKLRIPAGVRAGDGTPLGGRFTTVDELEDLRGVEDIRLPVYDSRDVNRGVEIGYARSLMDAEDVAHESASDDETVAAVWRDRAPQRTGYHFAYLVRFRQRRDDEPIEDVADEWEVGFEYESGEYGAPSANSDVDVNVRIRRNDGARFGKTEAKGVMDTFRDNLARGELYPVPVGYRLAGINWRNPKKSTAWKSHGDPADALANFFAPMYTAHANDDAWDGPRGTRNVRLGSVKK